MDVANHIRLWEKKEPWFYSARVFNERVYYLISFVIVQGALASFAFFPLTHVVAASVMGYLLSQFIFQFGHMTTHAMFIESPPEEWEPGVLVAWLHHYVHPRAIYKYWLVHRLNFIMQSKGCIVAYFAAWLVPFAFFGEAIGLLYAWFLFWFWMVEPAHEWYHVPRGMRKDHFSRPMYYWLSFLSSVGLLDEKGHLAHHAHTMGCMEKVTKFSDLYSPCTDLFFDRLWAMALAARDNKVFKTTPIRRAIYAQGVALVPVVFTLYSWMFCWASNYGG